MNELIEKFGYTLSEKTSYYFWDFDQGQAVDFCENMVVQLLNAGKTWSVDNKIVQIKNLKRIIQNEDKTLQLV